MHVLKIGLIRLIFLKMWSWESWWALFGSLVPAMCNRTSCPQVYKLPQSRCGDNRNGTLFSWLQIYNTHLASVRFEYSVCHGSLMTTYHIYIYIYIYGNHVCMYVSMYVCMYDVSMYVCIYVDTYVRMFNIFIPQPTMAWNDIGFNWIWNS